MTDTVQISQSDFIHQTAAMVAEVAKRHRIPHGTAFQIVAFGSQRFDQLADAAAARKALEQAEAADPDTAESTEEETPA